MEEKPEFILELFVRVERRGILVETGLHFGFVLSIFVRFCIAGCKYIIFSHLIIYSSLYIALASHVSHFNNPSDISG